MLIIFLYLTWFIQLLLINNIYLYEFNQVRVNTVLGSNAPPLAVKLSQAFSSSSKNALMIENQVLFHLKKNKKFLCSLLWNLLEMLFWIPQFFLSSMSLTVKCSLAFAHYRNSSLTQKKQFISWMLYRRTLILEITCLFLR